jgi:hypothetical protein
MQTSKQSSSVIGDVAYDQLESQAENIEHDVSVVYGEADTEIDTDADVDMDVESGGNGRIISKETDSSSIDGSNNSNDNESTNIINDEGYFGIIGLGVSFFLTMTSFMPAQTFATNTFPVSSSHLVRTLLLPLPFFLTIFHTILLQPYIRRLATILLDLI